MAGLQRSTLSFRRQGSSGFVWDDRFLSEELNKQKQEQEQGRDSQDRENEADQIKQPKPINTSRSNGGGRAYRTGKVSPAIEPPSPKVSACGFCSGFGKASKHNARRAKPGKRRSRL